MRLFNVFLMFLVFGAEAGRAGHARAEAPHPEAGAPSQAEAPHPEAGAPLDTAAGPAPKAVQPSVSNEPDGQVLLTLRAPRDVALVVTPLSGPNRVATRLCAGDCTEQLAKGRYRLALAYQTQMPVSAPHTLELARADVLEASYRSNRPKRIGGAVVLGVGIPLGLVTLLSGIVARANLEPSCASVSGSGEAVQCEEQEPNAKIKLQIASGAILSLLASGFGVWLVRHEDQASVRLRHASPENELVVDVVEAKPEPLLPELVAPAAPLLKMPVTPPLAPVAERRPVPAPAVSDAEELARERPRLMACFPTPPAGHAELIARVEANGKVTGVQPTVAISGEARACLERAMATVKFVPGSPRWLRIRLSK